MSFWPESYTISSRSYLPSPSVPSQDPPDTRTYEPMGCAEQSHVYLSDSYGGDCKVCDHHHGPGKPCALCVIERRITALEERYGTRDG